MGWEKLRTGGLGEVGLVGLACSSCIVGVLGRIV
jgi:hypothetical protein